MKTFPKTIYVKIEKEREPKDDFLIADKDYANLSEAETTIQIAEYRLIVVKYAVNKTELMI